MRTVAIYSLIGTKRDINVFSGVANKFSDEVYSVKDGVELASLCHTLVHDQKVRQCERISHLILCGHGSPVSWISPRNGVANKKRGARGISTAQFVDAIYPVLENPIDISLASCLCSRSPSWFLRLKFGQKLDSDWGPRSYRSGGQASFAARIASGLWWHNVRAYVRGHAAAGHASRLALIREHTWPGIDPGSSLFQQCFPDEVPTLKNRRKWVNLVTGRMAEELLMFDDTVMDEIKDRF